MKRPKKIIKIPFSDQKSFINYKKNYYVSRFDDGYNQAYNEWEKFLPSEIELVFIIENHKYQITSLAKAILKRIKGE